jgi:hypothetical protein
MIDDQIRISDAFVRLLVLEGFQVDCAPTAESGLAMARTRVHAEGPHFCDPCE